ncbi:MAG: dihydroorotate dehydrogenase-like protein [Chloroflexota bacterium]|nr:MAG: dihydroorotate dehydrogenase-like protein [Chloroflexota bacterium]UCF27697.1 MAG: dihydroorotate dehydrogenase-like protein [Chloroflexota bacterium]
MVDLSTSYLGLDLKNPLVASASPLSQKVETVRKLEEAGISAVVMYSLFEEQIIYDSLRLDRDLSQGTESFAEALTFFPDLAAQGDLNQYSIGPDDYVENLHNLKQAVDIPIIGSLNGMTNGGWIEYAQKIETAGADALELNIYNLSTNPEVSCLEIEKEYLDLVRAIRDSINIPIAVKLSPFFTNLPNFARNLVEAGANGLVLFNRFYQPDLDLEELEVVPRLVLSSSQELRLPLRWIAILYGRIAADLALTTGIHTTEDVLKATMAGASASMTASSILKYGIEHVVEILEGLEFWMEEHEYESINQMKGSMSQQAVAEPAAFERANYIKVLSSFDLRFAP